MNLKNIHEKKQRMNHKIKRTEIGKMPQDWKILKLSDIANVNMGQSPSSSTYNTTQEGLPFFQGRKDFGYKFPNVTVWCNEPKKIAQKGDILLSVRAPIGDVNTSKEKCCIGRGLSTICMKNDNDEFLYYLLLASRDRIRNIFEGEGTVFGCLTKDDLRGLEFAIPPEKQQRAIAKILSDLDEKIELNRQMNRTLESIVQAVFKHWFVDFEFPNEQGKPYKSIGGKMVESELGKIPAGWDVGRLKEALLAIESGSRPKGGIGSYSEGIPSVGAENILGLGQYDYSKTKYVPIDFYNQMKAGHIRNDDVLLYKDGAQLGRKSIFMDHFPFTKCCINEHVFILRPKEKITSTYLYLWLDQNWVTNEIVNLNANSAQPGINQDGVNSLLIIIPKVNIIKRFDNKIKPIFSRIFSNCLESNNLSQIRDSLLPKLMSGKIKLVEPKLQSLDEPNT